jgi:hypothetical protein
MMNNLAYYDTENNQDTILIFNTFTLKTQTSPPLLSANHESLSDHSTFLTLFDRASPNPSHQVWHLVNNICKLQYKCNCCVITQIEFKMFEWYNSFIQLLLDKEKTNLLYRVGQVKTIAEHGRERGRERTRERGERVRCSVLIKWGFGVSHKFDHWLNFSDLRDE